MKFRGSPAVEGSLYPDVGQKFFSWFHRDENVILAKLQVLSDYIAALCYHLTILWILGNSLTSHTGFGVIILQVDVAHRPCAGGPKPAARRGRCRKCTFFLNDTLCFCVNVPDSI